MLHKQRISRVCCHLSRCAFCRFPHCRVRSTTTANEMDRATFVRFRRHRIRKRSTEAFFAKEARTRERSSLLPPYEDDDGQRSCDHSSVQYRRRRWGTTIAPTFATSVDTESEIASVPDLSRRRGQRRATMKPNSFLTSAETIRQVSSVSIHPDRIRE